MAPLPPKIKSIPLKERSSLIFLEYGELDVLDGAFVLIDVRGVRVQVPIGGIACIMLEPGTRVSHAAVKLAAQVGCLLTWVGEGGVRLYSTGYPGGARSDRLIYQASIALNPDAAAGSYGKCSRSDFTNKSIPTYRSTNCVVSKGYG